MINKKLLGIALSALSIMTLANHANAQEQTPSETSAQVEAVPSGRTLPIKMKMKFKGLNLTPEQRARLSAIELRYDSVRGMRGLKARKAACDTTIMPRAGKANKGRKCNKSRKPSTRPDSAAISSMTSTRLEYLKELKDELTPEQYTQFLENNFVYARVPHHNKKAHRSHKGAPHRYAREATRDNHRQD